MSSELSSLNPSPKPVKATKAVKAKAKASSGKQTIKATKSAPTHPSWKDIIRECIVAHPNDTRAGVSRAAIKKFAEDRYGLEPNNANVSLLARAIASGVEEELFSLPKGPVGKIKLFKRKVVSGTTKENTKPPTKKNPEASSKPKKLAVKKAASDKPKKSTPKAVAGKPKKTLAKAPASKVAVLSKKVVKGKVKPTEKAPKKTSSARAEAKKPAAKAAAAKAVKTAKIPTSKTKTKPASKKAKA